MESNLVPKNNKRYSGVEVMESHWDEGVVTFGELISKGLFENERVNEKMKQANNAFLLNITKDYLDGIQKEVCNHYGQISFHRNDYFNPAQDPSRQVFR
ncbi:hypothetical protein [Anoxynatronum buryatiense]|uniref:hypothetical protein n=1 Tax=Anoxynatronum buryatiense TaxID=489973 RepID=UPI0024B7C062|nr:hypothetical protein [Anoxynatronum buryatiense]